MRQIVLHRLSPNTLTSYVRGGGGATRTQGRVPSIPQLLTVAGAPAHSFRASPQTVAALDRLNAAMLAAGMEPCRITETYRSPEVQQKARNGYDAWLEAGRPDPHSPGWRAGMKMAYVARPGASNHGWGGAIDIDVGALSAPGVTRGSNAALEHFWALAKAEGFSPVLSEPLASASEAWHFDRLGPLRAVRSMYDAEASTHPRYRGGYGHTARVGCALAGSLPDQSDAMFIQARLLIAGHWCGLVDGQIGPMTRAALAAAGVEMKVLRAGVPAILAELNRLQVGYAEIKRA